MFWAETVKWVNESVEQFPIVPPHEKTIRRYPNGIGIQLKVAEKKELERRLKEDIESAKTIQAFIWTYGVLIFRCMDDEPFSKFSKREADIGSPAHSIPFHVDVNQRICRDYDDMTKSEYWVSGSQGLYQDPVKDGRSMDTLIAHAPLVAEVMLEQMDPNKSKLPEDLRIYFKESVKKGMRTRSKGTCKKTALIMAWSTHNLKNTSLKDQDALEKDEIINQLIYAEVPQLLRISWGNPELTSGGLAVLWDAGYKDSKRRLTVHGRDNKGEVLPKDKANLYRI